VLPVSSGRNPGAQTEAGGQVGESRQFGPWHRFLIRFARPGKHLNGREVQ
jgi:hypothetical protein